MSKHTAHADDEQNPNATLAIESYAGLDVLESGGHYYLTGPQSAWEKLERVARDMQEQADALPGDSEDTVEINRETLQSLLELVYMYRGDERVTHDAEMETRFDVVHDIESNL